MTTIPLCHKCREAIIVQVDSGISEFRGCKKVPGVVNYSEAQKQCPLIKDEPVMTQPKYRIYPIENPDPSKWEGHWFGFANDTCITEGRAHESVLHLYVGEEAAREAINKVKGQ